MRSLNMKEIEIINWTLTYISPLCVDKKHRGYITSLSGKALPKTLSEGQKEAISAALNYYIDFYNLTASRYPKNNITIKSIICRSDLMRSVVNKLSVK